MNILSLKHSQVALLASLNNQGWTNYSIPSDISILHDFGNGMEPASPVDNAAFNNDIMSFVARAVDKDNAAFSNDIVSFVARAVDKDNIAFANDIISFTTRMVNLDSAAFNNDIIEFSATQVNEFGEPIVGH